MSIITDNKFQVEAPLNLIGQQDRGSAQQLLQENPIIDSSRSLSPRQQAEIARERWAGPLTALDRLPLFNREITRQTTQNALQNHLAFQCSSMVIQVCSSNGPSIGGIPLDIMQRLFGQELVNRTLEIPQAICIVGHTLAQTAKPRMSMSELEQVGRLSFGVLRHVETLKQQGLKVEGVLDTDLMNTPEYREVRRELQPFASKTYPLAFDEACLYETARRVFGAQVVNGWTSFKTTDEFENAKQGLSSNRDWVRNCSMHAQNVLDAAVPGEFAVVAMEPGRSVLGVSKPANPDVISPLTSYGIPTRSDEHGRILLNAQQPEQLKTRFSDIFDLDPAAQRTQLQDQSHYWKLFQNINRVNPELLPNQEQKLADLAITERVLQACKENCRYEPTKGNEQALWQAVLAAAYARAPILVEYIRHVVGEYSPNLAGINGTSTRLSGVAGLSSLSDSPDVPTLNDSSFEERSTKSRSPGRGTFSMSGANFRQTSMSMTAAVAPGTDPMKPAGQSDSDGDNDDEQGFAA